MRGKAELNTEQKRNILQTESKRLVSEHAASEVVVEIGIASTLLSYS